MEPLQRVALYAGFPAHRQVEGDDGELARPLPGLHPSEQRGRNDVDAAESQFPELALPVDKSFGFHLAGGLVEPPVQLLLLVEQQVAGGLPLADKQRGLGIAIHMVAVEGGKVYVGEDVGIVYQKRFIAVQERTGFSDAASGVEQHVPFVTEVDGDAEVVAGTQEVDNLFSEVVDVDGDVVESRLFQAQYDPLQHRFSGYGDKRFGRMVCQRTQPGAQTGCENHGFHLALNVCSMFCSR